MCSVIQHFIYYLVDSSCLGMYDVTHSMSNYLCYLNHFCPH